MRRGDVVTFFYEMGHVFNALPSRTNFSCFHGINIAGDFVEAQSQMLNNQCFEPKFLELMDSHYESGKPMDAGLMDKIIQM